jgi:hypothetical protein
MRLSALRLPPGIELSQRTDARLVAQHDVFGDRHVRDDHQLLKYGDTRIDVRRQAARAGRDAPAPATPYLDSGRSVGRSDRPSSIVGPEPQYR